MRIEKLLQEAGRRAGVYAELAAKRQVVPDAEAVRGLTEFEEPFPEDGLDAAEVLRRLDTFGSPATVASTGGRYYGFVTGGALPAAMAANLLAGAWDQNGGMRVMSPVAAKLEDVTIGWLRELFALPASVAAGFVTGATMANFTCLAAARHALLKRAGWDAEEQGLFDAPELQVVVSDEVHVSLTKALALLGLGRSRVHRVPTDEQGRMRADLLPRLNERTIVCLQAGNVNSGAFDPAEKIIKAAQGASAWVHVDGAFGLWAAAAPARKHLMAGFEQADSWATDCHKWLNVPYDSGLAMVREGQYLQAAMALSAAYLQTSGEREPCCFTPEASRRARAIEVWAALRSLGRQGLGEMIEGNCRMATRFAQQLASGGYEILNDVALNQVMVSFGDPAKTRRVVAELQHEGTCWCGATEWQGKTAMRISVSCWATTAEDVDRSVAAMLRIAADQ